MNSIFNNINKAMMPEISEISLGSAGSLLNINLSPEQVDDFINCTEVVDPATINNSFFSQEDNKDLWHDINMTKPSDVISLSYEDSIHLMEYYDKYIGSCTKNKSIGYSADIFFSKTVSLKDSEISVVIQAGDDSIDFHLRIVIFDDYAERVDEILSGYAENVAVGAIVIDYTKSSNPKLSCVRQLACPIVIEYGNDAIMLAQKIGYLGFNVSIFNLIFDGKDDDVIDHEKVILTLALKLWYTIQILLLHPNKETIITESRTPVEPKAISKYAKAKNKKRKAKLIRKLQIHTDHLNDPITERQGGIDRKTLCWYVVGHWRTYKKTGKKIFIQPHWKGPLRETKQNLDLGRDREANFEDLDDNG